MSGAHEMNQAKYLLSGLENGTLSSSKAYTIAAELDPVLIYFTIRFLRENYPTSHPDGQGVMERLLELTSIHPELVTKSKKGEKDPIREWFDDTHSISEFRNRAEEFIEFIYEKIDG
jgi:hypothetical protein